MSDMIKQIKELRTTISEQTEAINTERIINSEQAEQLKEAEVLLLRAMDKIEYMGYHLDLIEDYHSYLAKYKGKE